jgi:hypothetical protein
MVEVAGQGVVDPAVVPETPVPIVLLPVVPALVVPVVLPVLVVPLQFVLVVEPETPVLGVVPMAVPPFWLALGVVPAAAPVVPVDAPMLPVDVLGLVAGVATPPVGVCVLTVPLTAGEVPLTLPVAPACGVCPAPAGNVAVPFEVVFAADPVVPTPLADPAVPVVCAAAKAVQQRASVAVIKSFRMKSPCVVSFWFVELDDSTIVSGGRKRGSGWIFVTAKQGQVFLNLAQSKLHRFDRFSSKSIRKRQFSPFNYLANGFNRLVTIRHNTA